MSDPPNTTRKLQKGEKPAYIAGVSLFRSSVCPNQDLMTCDNEDATANMIQWRGLPHEEARGRTRRGLAHLPTRFVVLIFHLCIILILSILQQNPHHCQRMRRKYPFPSFLTYQQTPNLRNWAFTLDFKGYGLYLATATAYQ